MTYQKQAEGLTKTLGFPVSAGMLAEWRRKDYPLDDIQALVDTLAGQVRRPKGFDDAVQAGKIALTPPGDDLGGKDITELSRLLKVEQIRKTAAEAKIKEVQAVAEREKWVTREDHDAVLQQIGALEKTDWMQLESIFPPMLAGMEHDEMARKIAQHARKVLEKRHRKLKDLELEKEE